jgi:dihydrofolate reductase
MGKLIYASNMSLDGCTEDEQGAVDWAPPDDDVFVFITELMRSAGTYLYGRRMYETMAVWETDATLADQSDLTADYASTWQAADKVVYSSTLAAPLTTNTRLERHFDPGAVRDLKAAVSGDLLIGGPNLAAQAMGAGLVDELALIVWPVVLGGRKLAGTITRTAVRAITLRTLRLTYRVFVVTYHLDGATVAHGTLFRRIYHATKGSIVVQAFRRRIRIVP